MGAYAVIVRSPDTVEQRLVFDRDEVTIGRIAGNDIVLATGAVSRRHARLVIKHERFILVDLKSTNGTFVNGRRMTSPLALRGGDQVRIGDFTLTFEDVEEPTTEWIPEPEIESVEAALLARIAQRDDGARMVYADWLEERGDVGRAEFLRVQETLGELSPEDPAFRAAKQHLEELASTIDVFWRIKVGRPAIEQCMAYDFECPKEWGALEPTARRDVRFCTACERSVFYCRTISEARAHSERGDCVCVDIALPRRRGDLDGPRMPAPPGMMVVR